MNEIMYNYFDVDLVTIIVAYLFVSYGKTGAGFFAFGQGFLIDIFSAGLLGLFTLLYLVVFLGINLGHRFFNLHSPRGLILLISLAVLLKGLLFIVFLDVFSLEIIVSSSSFLSLAVSALWTGLVAPFFFYIFNQTDRFFMKFKREAS
jgi:rod shape-determining protein MreD